MPPKKASGKAKNSKAKKPLTKSRSKSRTPLKSKSHSHQSHHTKSRSASAKKAKVPRKKKTSAQKARKGSRPGSADNNPWIAHVRAFAEKKGINYREAMQHRDIRKGYKKVTPKKKSGSVKPRGPRMTPGTSCKNKASKTGKDHELFWYKKEGKLHHSCVPKCQADQLRNPLSHRCLKDKNSASRVYKSKAFKSSWKDEKSSIGSGSGSSGMSRTTKEFQKFVDAVKGMGITSTSPRKRAAKGQGKKYVPTGKGRGRPKKSSSSMSSSG